MHSDFLNLPSPIEEINLPIIENACVRLFIKREDLIHPLLSGNKWRKLKYNLLHVQNSENKRVLTFGGAFSNHLYAFAAACSLYDLEGIAMVRGDKYDPNNPTLQFANAKNVDLQFLDRITYRRKNESAFTQAIQNEYNAFIIPEGGSNNLGFAGVEEIMKEEKATWNNVIVAAGTGCTAAGIISSVENHSVHVIPVLKGDFLKKEINNWLTQSKDFYFYQDYHFGGYARTSPELITFINAFQYKTGIPLDPIYTGKLMYATLDLIKKGYFKKDSKILVIHTGGIQGVAGYNYRNPTAPINSL